MRTRAVVMLAAASLSTGCFSTLQDSAPSRPYETTTATCGGYAYPAAAAALAITAAVAGAYLDNTAADRMPESGIGRHNAHHVLYPLAVVNAIDALVSYESARSCAEYRAYVESRELAGE